MDRLQAMQAFVAVVEAGSFTAAGDKLGRTKSQVSKQVSGLEDSLGIQLLQRSTRQLAVTQMGQSYYEQIRLVLQNLREIDEGLRDQASVAQGLLRISAPVSYGTRCLAHHFAAFGAAYPGITLQINLSDSYVDLVQQGYDLALRIGALEDSSLKQRQLARLPFVYVASPEYLAGTQRIQHPEDLRRHQGLVYTLRESGGRWSFEHPQQGKLSIEPTQRLASNNGDVLVEAALQGLGVAAVPRFFVEDALEAGDLVSVLSDWEPEDLSLVAVYPATRYLSRKARVFIDFLVKALAG